MKKRRIFIRLLPGNRLSFPLLLNTWEKNGIDQEFEIILCSDTKTLERLAKDDVILYSFMTPDLPLVQRELDKIKERGVIIAGGGPHISGEQELAKKIGFHTLFVGPGERVFLQFGLDLLDNRVAEGLYRDSGEHKESAFDAHLPISTHLPTIPPLEIMRGCFWKCKYCQTHLERSQSRSLQSVKAFLEELKRRNFCRINFISPSSLEYGAEKPRQVNVEKIEALLHLTRSFGFQFVEYGIFPSEIRPDTVTDAGMKALKKVVSNKAVTIGAQSCLDTRLRELQRGHTRQDIERAVEIANANGFLANLDFIIGYPAESRQEREANIEFIKRMNKRYRIKSHLHFFIPLPGSGYAYRLPSFLSPQEKEKLGHLKKSGIANDGWLDNEIKAGNYLQWLRQHFPDHYARYRT